MTAVRHSKKLHINVLFICLFSFLIIMMFPLGVYAADTLKAGWSDNINETGKYAPSLSITVPDTSFNEFRLVMPESGFLFLKCSWDFYDDENYQFVWLSHNKFGDKWVYPEQRFPVYENSKLAAGYLEKGTYYVQVSNIDEEKSYQFNAWYYRTANMKLPAGVRKTGACYDKTGIGHDVSQFFRVTVPKRGYLKVNIRQRGSKKYPAIINVYDNSKKLFVHEYVQIKKPSKDEYAFFAVEPGTYYLRTRRFTGPFSIRFTFHPTKDRNNTLNRTTAPVLAKGRVHYSTFYTKDTASKWTRYYKITPAADCRVWVYYGEEKTDFCKITLIDKKGKPVPVIKKTGCFRTKRDVGAGPYYIRVKCSFDESYRKTSMGIVQKISWEEDY